MRKVIFSLSLLFALSFVFATAEDIAYIEKMTISGNVSTNILQLSGNGGVLNGNNVKVYLLGPVENVNVYNLIVNNTETPVSFDYYGYFFIANSSKFTFTAEVKLLPLGQIQLYFPTPVNHLTFNLKDGYAVGGNEFYSVFDEEKIIQRNKVPEVLVEGDFHFIFEQENNFEYVIDFSSLGESLSTYTLNLKNNENIRSVSGAVDYAVKDNSLVLDLTGSTATVIVKGTFNSDFLRIPLNNGTHDVLLESKPEKKLIVSTTAEVIDISKSSIVPKYYNSQAFLAVANDSFDVIVENLTLLPSLTFSVSNAYNYLALNEKGTVLGQLNYNYANSGEEYIRLNVPGTPLYAETSEGAVMLTTDRENSLLLSIPKTNYGSLILTYLTTVSKMFLVSLFKVPLANSSMPISEMTTYVYLPNDYFVLFTLGAENFEGTEIPGIGTIIFFLVVSIALGYFLNKDCKFINKYVIIMFGLTLLSPSLLVLVWFISLGLIVKKYLDEKYHKIILIVTGIIVAIIAIIFMLTFLITPYAGGEVAYSGEARGISATAAPEFNALQKVGTGEGAISVPTETGVLPVDFEIPYIGKTISLTSTLVTVEKPVSYTMVLINSNLKYIIVAYSIFLLAKLLLSLKKEQPKKSAKKI